MAKVNTLVNTGYSAEVFASAYQQYITTRVTPKDLAKSLGLPIQVVRDWIAAHDWDGKRAEIEDGLLSKADLDLKEHISTQRLDTAKRHLETATLLEKYIRDKIQRAIDSPKGFITENDLQKLAKALKDSADVSARAVGLNDRMFESRAPASSSAAASRMIWVGIQPRDLPAGHPNRPPEIDITADVSVGPAGDPEPF